MVVQLFLLQQTSETSCVLDVSCRFEVSARKLINSASSKLTHPRHASDCECWSAGTLLDSERSRIRFLPTISLFAGVPTPASSATTRTQWEWSSKWTISTIATKARRKPWLTEVPNFSQRKPYSVRLTSPHLICVSFAEELF